MRQKRVRNIEDKLMENKKLRKERKQLLGHKRRPQENCYTLSGNNIQIVGVLEKGGGQKFYLKKL